MLRTLAAAVVIAAFAASPALAATKAKAKRSCYDLAWESQAQKDCLAKGTTPTAAPKPAKTAKKMKKSA